VGPEVPNGGTCELLTNSTESLPAALAFQSDSNPWPKVHDNLTSADSIALRSVSWMCWRQQQDWDAFGRATHNMISSGTVEGEGVEDMWVCGWGGGGRQHSMLQPTTALQRGQRSLTADGAALPLQSSSCKGKSGKCVRVFSDHLIYILLCSGLSLRCDISLQIVGHWQAAAMAGLSHGLSRD
jgi:hypothetical protein